MGATTTALEESEQHICSWKKEEDSVELDADGHGRRLYRVIIGRLVAVEEFENLVATAMRPAPITGREIVEKHLHRDLAAQQRVLDARTVPSRREAVRLVTAANPVLAAAVDEANEKARSDGRNFAQLRRDLNITEERVKLHVKTVLKHRQLARLHADGLAYKGALDAARAASKTASQEAEIAEIEFRRARDRNNESGCAENEMARIKSGFPILFQDGHDYALVDPKQKGRPAQRKRGAAWVGRLLGGT